MSRAFVKERDGAEPEPPARVPRTQPYYMTPEGFAALRARLESAADANEREVADLAERLEAAVVVNPEDVEDDAVHFGAYVTVEEPGKKRQRYRIVGEDEADPLTGTISWRSPLAQALMDHHAGDRVVWQRPAGNLPLRIVAVTYT